MGVSSGSVSSRSPTAAAGIGRAAILFALSERCPRAGDTDPTEAVGSRCSATGLASEGPISGAGRNLPRLQADNFKGSLYPNSAATACRYARLARSRTQAVDWSAVGVTPAFQFRSEDLSAVVPARDSRQAQAHTCRGCPDRWSSRRHARSAPLAQRAGRVEISHIPPWAHGNACAGRGCTASQVDDRRQRPPVDCTCICTFSDRRGGFSSQRTQHPMDQTDKSP